jgi:hypothetical protein
LSQEAEKMGKCFDSRYLEWWNLYWQKEDLTSVEGDTFFVSLKINIFNKLIQYLGIRKSSN